MIATTNTIAIGIGERFRIDEVTELSRWTTRILERTRLVELIVDSFAGGGGASLGIAWATGRAPDIAINHDAAAIAMHEKNHPSTTHFTEDVWRVNPRVATRGRKVGLLWASPDCKHFSRAKGGKPVEKKIRSLAWVVVKWAAEVGPRVIILENVREFADWGPLVPQIRCGGCDWRGTEGQVVRTRRKCPRCEGRKLVPSADMVPCPARKGQTFRRWVGRLKSLGYKVEWRNLDAADFGAPTHRRRLFLVARNDGEAIVWPEPTHGDPKKVASLFDQLKPWRTAASCIDWSIPCPSIFERKKPLAEKTLRRIAHGIKRYVLDSPQPFIVRYRGEAEGSSVGTDSPLPTVTANSYIKRPGGAAPLAIATPILAPLTHSGERRCHEAGEPLPTITTAKRGEVALISPTLVAAFLAKHFGDTGQRPGIPMEEPVATVTAADHHSLVAANLVHLNHGEKQWSSVDEPARAQTTANHAALVYSFLVKYFGTAIGQEVDIPLHTATGKARFGLVTVEIDGEPYVIVDIGMRMLSPRELARAQGFPDTYELTGTKTSQVARIGNSVCPPIAKAMVEANYCRVLGGASHE